MSKKKKDVSKKLLEMHYEELQLVHDYLTEGLNEVKPQYLSSVTEDTKKKDYDCLEDESNHEEPWSFLKSVDSAEDVSQQEKNAMALDLILSDHETDNTATKLLDLLRKSELRVQFHAFIEIDFSERTYNKNLLAGDIGHAAGYFKFAGDDTLYWFESPGNKHMDAKIIACLPGDAEGPAGPNRYPEAYLEITTESRERVVYELEEFKLLALADMWEKDEFGLFTVFSKKLRFLYADIVVGDPKLDSATIKPVSSIGFALVPYQSLCYIKLRENNR